MKALAMFAKTQPGGYCREGVHGTWELVTTAPVPFLNGVIGIARDADSEEVAAFAGSPRLESVPWSVQLRGEQVGERILKTVASHDLHQRLELPFMTKDLRRSTPQEPATKRSKARKLTAEEGDLYRTTMAAGYESPEEIFSVFASPFLMDHPFMESYIVEVEGIPVATSFGVRVDDLVGVFNVAVPPQHRRRGYGKAATEAVLRDAREQGARAAFLHASPLGFPLYETMGFQLEEKWTLFLP